jgi:hypothetical protein
MIRISYVLSAGGSGREAISSVHYTSTYSSLLNQVEIRFARIERDSLRPTSKEG